MTTSSKEESDDTVGPATSHVERSDRHILGPMTLIFVIIDDRLVMKQLDDSRTF